ncbi:MAG: DUF2029 domain-containing protein [Chloroflexi bacterium]|nr:MAG: DUF2029 domain-containing protein [Chloroflexota bacterium]
MTRFERWMIAITVAFALAGAAVVLHQSSIGRRSADFTIDYSAALLIRQGHPAAVYQPDQLGPLMQKLSDHAIDQRLPFDAPLAMALPYVPLTYLDLETAFHVWQLLTLGFLALSLVLLARWYPLGRRARVFGGLGLLAFPATWALLTEGQSSALLVLGAVSLVGAARRGSWQLAGLGSCLIAIKPQYLPVYLLLFVTRRQWQPLAAALVAALAVALSPLLAGGLDGLSSMVWSALDAGQGVIRDNESLIGALGPWLPGRMPTIAAFSIWILALTALLLLAVRRPARADPVAITVLLTCAGVLFAPHALPYDTVLLVVPAWLAFELDRRGQIPTPVPCGLAIATAMVIDLASPLINLVPLLLLLSVIGYAYVRRLRQQTRLELTASGERAA